MLNKIASLLFMFAVPALATVNITPSSSTQQIQSAITSAPAGSTVSFAAGTYNITAPLQVPCANLQLTGASATGVNLVATFSNNALFAYPGNCTQPGAISYLGIVSNGGVYFGIGNNSNFTFAHNQVTGLVNAAGVFFDGNIGTTLSNIAVTDNTFGDQNSCAVIFSAPTDSGGYCSGVTTAIQKLISNLVIDRNTFLHLEEGVHLNQITGWNPGVAYAACSGCSIQYNTVQNYKRIGIEVQTGTITSPTLVAHNAVLDPIASTWGTFAVSLACCQWGQIQGTAATVAGVIFDDNVLVSSLPCGVKCPPIGVEFWGNGSQGTNSLVEGTFSNGYTWGFGAGSWAINNNYICGPNYPTQGGYISNQQEQNNPPSQTGNTTSATCNTKVSGTPTISTTNGTLTVSVTTPNTSIWYTTDGSNPAPGSSRLYTSPVPLSSTTTVKAVGMWGSPNQPTSYPAGYGYVPSPVVSATYTVVAPPPAATCLDIKLKVLTGSGTQTMSGTFNTAPITCQ